MKNIILKSVFFFALLLSFSACTLDKEEVRPSQTKSDKSNIIETPKDPKALYQPSNR